MGRRILNSNMKHKYFLFISILTFIVVVAWIGFNLYHTSITSTVDQTLSFQIAPITPDFNDTVLETLRNRETILSVVSLESTAASDAAEVQNTEPSPTPEVTIDTQTAPEGTQGATP